MKKHILSALLLLFLVKTLIAQVTMPPVYEINTDTASMQKLDSIYWQKLEDKEGKWTFEDVRNEPLTGKFHIQGVKADGIDTNGIHTYWHRYRLKNVMTSDAKISLRSSVDFFDVYVIKEDSTVVHYRSGRLRKWEDKDGLKSADWSGVLPLVLSPGEMVTVYDRRNRLRDTNFRTSAHFVSTEKMIQKEYVEYRDNRDIIYGSFHLQEAFILGLIFLSIFISFFFYRVVNEKVYIYFALFAVFLGINRNYNIADTYTSLFAPEWHRYVGYIGFAWMFIPFFLIQFIRNFFEIKKDFPKWNRFLLLLGFSNLIMGCIASVLYILSALTPWLNQIFTLISVFLIPLSVFCTVIIYLNKGSNSYRYLAVGAIPLMLLYVIAFVAQNPAYFSDGVASIFSGLISSFRFIEAIALSWLIVCFTWVLFLRFDRLRKENIQQALDKERLAKEKEIERNELIAAQKIQLEVEVSERTAELKQSLNDLKSTQSQLIQSEKMASLGELTAGIAHEIQNPLNFVNNFSEVSRELIEELKSQKSKLKTEEQEEILNDIDANLEKINHHGKRADAIVKGMLQHSRSSSGQKELTDINALCDEYLRLAYHGLRAKDKSFNAKFESNFDNTIQKVNIVTQDIGRVLLNLINNAFYAVSEKAKQNISGYEPTVTVYTKNLNGKVEISVKDNGNGIPESIIEKIFQPFFTTKPTGQGTGLGLSLSYDIVKAHGGELKVETKEGEGTTFIIILVTNDTV